MTFLVPPVPEVGFSLFLFPWLVSCLIVDERSLGSILVVEEREALVVNPEFKEFPMLDDIEHVIAYLEGVLEGSPEFLTLEHLLPILQDLLLPT